MFLQLYQYSKTILLATVFIKFEASDTQFFLILLVKKLLLWLYLSFPPPNSYVEVLGPVTQNIYQVKMRSLGRALIHITDVLVKWGNLETDLHMGRTPCEHENSHLLAKEEGWEQILCSQPSEGTNYANILILNF